MQLLNWNNFLNTSLRSMLYNFFSDSRRKERTGKPKTACQCGFYGRSGETQTRDPRIPNAVRYRLRYTPKYNMYCFVVVVVVKRPFFGLS